MTDLHAMQFLKERIDELKADGLYKKFKTVEGANEAVCVIDGKKVINLSSNNYLGFANHPRLKQAAIKAIEEYGVGAGAVRPINGNLTIHNELEQLLAEFKREEAVIVFQSGFNCNAGTIQAVVDAGDLIISDELNHASIIDGCRLSKAKKTVFKHSDMADLERVLKENRAQYRQVLIVTDGVFSMDGDIANLPGIVELAEKYNCLTYVDDAHASGVLGQSGRGTVDHFGLHGKVDFIMGTLSKAIGVIGGYIAGKQVTIDWLKNRGRPLLFSTGNTPADTAAVMEAIRMLMESEEYTEKLWDNARYFKAKINQSGLNTGHSETPITPIIIGDEAQTGIFSEKLFANGVFTSPIVFPTVPKGTGRVRCMVTAGHSREQLAEAAEIIAKVAKELHII